MSTTLPSDITAHCIGIFLEDSEACKWSRCSRESHQQFQRFEFKKMATATRMVDLSTPALRPLAAIGRVAHVCISTAEEWLGIPKLPSHVRGVTIQIGSSEELQKLYPADCETSESVMLPSTVSKLLIECCRSPLDRWLDHLVIPSNSCLSIFRLQRGLASFPRFVRHSLPDTLVELELPTSFPFIKDVKKLQPSADEYPAHWPPNLTKLSVSCEPASPFEAGALPPLPSKITTFCGLEGDLKGARLQEMVKNLPDSVTFLMSAGIQRLDGHWKLPSGLRSLHLFYLKEIDLSPELPAFKFPPALQEIYFSNSTLGDITSIFPDSLTSIYLFVSPTTIKPFQGVKWPSQLRKLHLVAQTGTDSLRDWTPPAQLTDLTINCWDMLLDDVPLPTTLRSLTLQNYSQSLAGVTFPLLLEHMAFIGHKVPSLSSGMWHPPPRLQSVKLSVYQSDLFLPATLKRFTTATNFNPTSFEELGKILPQELEELDLSGLAFSCSLPLDSLAMPAKLRCLRLQSFPFLCQSELGRFPTASQIPPSLRELWMIGNLQAERLSEVTEWAARALPVQCALLMGTKE